MDLFDPEPLVHTIAKRSWWDGTVTSYCGQRRKPSEITEHFFGGGNTCPACKAAKKRKKP